MISPYESSLQGSVATWGRDEIGPDLPSGKLTWLCLSLGFWEHPAYTLGQSNIDGGLEHFVFFHSVGNVIIPTDEVIFFRGVGSTTNIDVIKITIKDKGTLW